MPRECLILLPLPVRPDQGRYLGSVHMSHTEDRPMNTTIVVPVYNEEKRLKVDRFVTFVEKHTDIIILFANDGSTDGTRQILYGLSRHPSGRLRFLDLPRNCGKAEAVRSGVEYALRDESIKYVGYLDADLSTPIEELCEFIAILDRRPDVLVVLGSRVKLLGRLVQRRNLRHYLGRIFATVASIVLGIGVYDTQCGAKLLRATPAIRAIFDVPFRSRWIFDVEMIARLARESHLKQDQLAAVMVEHPLTEWQEVAGSKVKMRDFFVAIAEMASVHLNYRAYLR